MKAIAVARNTFLEARRDRVQWILLLYAAVVVGGAVVMSPLAMGEGYRITRDLGLAALSMVGVLLIVLVGGGMVHKEVERRTILTVLAKPVRRSEFLFGKYLGLLGMVFSVFIAMTALLSGVLMLQEGRVETAVLTAAAFTLGEFMVMTAAVVFFSTFATPALATIFAVALFIMGHLSEDLLRFAERAPDATTAWGAKVVYFMLPHLDVFNLRAEAAYSVIPDPSRMMFATAYALLYSAALIALASMVFSRREFR